MKKINALVLGFMAIAVLSSCLKDNVSPDDSEERYRKYVEERLAIETPLIQTYVTENGIAATKDEETGIWYALESPGEGNHAYYTGTPPYSQFVQTKMLVEYTGRLLNGEVFGELTDPDPESDYMFLFSDPQRQVDGVIPAWQHTFLPRTVGGLFSNGLQEGARVRIITPSPYAYQDQERKNPQTGEVIIPANSVLDFTIEVLTLENPNN